MKKTRYNEEQIIGVLKRMEAGQKERELARELGVTPSHEEEERSAARSIEQQALAAPTSVRQNSASAWTQETQPATRTAAVAPGAASVLGNSTASNDGAVSPQGANKSLSEFEEQNMQSRKEAFSACKSWRKVISLTPWPVWSHTSQPSPAHCGHKRRQDIKS
jgi:hypothetical protein